VLATPEQLAEAATQAIAVGKSPRKHAVHICGTHSKLIPQIYVENKVRNTHLQHHCAVYKPTLLTSFCMMCIPCRCLFLCTVQQLQQQQQPHPFKHLDECSVISPTSHPCASPPHPAVLKAVLALLHHLTRVPLTPTSPSSNVMQLLYWPWMDRNRRILHSKSTENLDAILMKQILKKHLMKSANKFWPKGIWHFQQDNDPKHTSRLVSDYLEREICIKDYIIKWPPYSPDLNPIENLWANLKKRVERHTANTVQELEHAVKTEWANTDTTLCRKLVNSMPDRIARLKEYRGGPTGY
jgi:hypothetical protein